MGVVQLDRQADLLVDLFQFHDWQLQLGDLWAGSGSGGAGRSVSCFDRLLRVMCVRVHAEGRRGKEGGIGIGRRAWGAND